MVAWVEGAANAPKIHSNSREALFLFPLLQIEPEWMDWKQESKQSNQTIEWMNAHTKQSISPWPLGKKYVSKNKYNGCVLIKIRFQFGGGVADAGQFCGQFSMLGAQTEFSSWTTDKNANFMPILEKQRQFENENRVPNLPLFLLQQSTEVSGGALTRYPLKILISVVAV